MDDFKALIDYNASVYRALYLVAKEKGDGIAETYRFAHNALVNMRKIVRADYLEIVAQGGWPPATEYLSE